MQCLIEDTKYIHGYIETPIRVIINLETKSVYVRFLNTTDGWFNHSNVIKKKKQFIEFLRQRCYININDPNFNGRFELYPLTYVFHGIIDNDSCNLLKLSISENPWIIEYEENDA